MILGTGIDFIEVERVKKASENERFMQRVFTDGERRYFKERNDNSQSIAGIFAAKEAAAKALGTGFSDGVGLKNIEITHDELGKPSAVLTGSALNRMQTLGARTLHISISNIKLLALAQAILEG